MNSKTRLAAWLGSKHKDYREGLSVFKDLGINPDKIAFFSVSKHGTIHMNMLTNELVRYARVNQIRPANQKRLQEIEQKKKETLKEITARKKPLTSARPGLSNLEGKVRIEILNNPKISYEQLPEELKIVYDEFKSLYQNYETKRGELMEIPESPDKSGERKILAIEVVHLKQNIRKNWDRIDSWWNSREMKETGEKQPAIAEPSGKYTKAEIEAMENPEIKALSKKMRIETNLKFIGRNPAPKDEKTRIKLETRKRELKEWGVDYAAAIQKN